MGPCQLVSRRSSRLARRAALAIPLAALLALSTPIVASAGSGGVVGDPQPELAPFTVGAAGGGTGTGAALADGLFVLASPSTSGATISVCTLPHGARACAATATLHAHAGDTFSGTVEVLATGRNDVAVVAYDCCTIGADTAVLFYSTDGGRAFGPLVEAGTLSSIGAGTAVGSQVIIGTYETGGGTQVQALSPTGSSPNTEVATVHAGDDGTTALTSYDGGVLVASDDTTNTYVEYAKAGSDFSSSASYKLVGTFPNETVSGVSGSALLTDPGGSLTGGERLRLFNGTGFGTPRKVPDAPHGDDGAFCLQQEGGVAHVFFISRRNNYDAYEDLTTTGASWTQVAYTLGSAIDASGLAPVLGSLGAGLLYETDGTPLRAQPVLDSVHVHVALAARRVKVGHGTHLTGGADPTEARALVVLQTLRSGRWYNVATTREADFRFGIPGRTATYRAMVEMAPPGYYLYGYSNAVTLVAVR